MPMGPGRLPQLTTLLVHRLLPYFNGKSSKLLVGLLDL